MKTKRAQIKVCVLPPVPEKIRTAFVFGCYLAPNFTFIFLCLFGKYSPGLLGDRNLLHGLCSILWRAEKLAFIIAISPAALYFKLT